MGGLRRILKAHGKMNIQGVMWVWDYVKDEPVKESEQTKEEWAASEKKKWELVKDQIK